MPMITFSFRPSRWSTLPLMAASVSTLVVSWKEAADRKDSVASDALVMPSSSRVQVGRTSSSPSSRFSPAAMRARTAAQASRYSMISTVEPDSSSESPDSSTRTLRIIWRTMTSMCLSLMSTPCWR